MDRLTNRLIVVWSFAAAYSVAYHLLMVVVRDPKRVLTASNQIGSSRLQRVCDAAPGGSRERFGLCRRGQDSRSQLPLREI